jgi:hypothetical protein
MSVEKPENDSEERHSRNDPGQKPPGQFVSDDLEQQTARFLEQVKRLGRHRQEVEAAEEAKGGPPPPDQP